MLGGSPPSYCTLIIILIAMQGHQRPLRCSLIFVQNFINMKQQCNFIWWSFVPSTCPLHTNSGCGKERRILIGPWWPAKAALFRNYREVYWPCAGGLSAVNAIGTQLRDPINLGLTRWRGVCMHDVCFVCFLPIYCGHQVRWTYEPVDPGSSVGTS